MKTLLATTMVLGVIFTFSNQPTGAIVVQPPAANTQTQIMPARYYYYSDGPYYRRGYVVEPYGPGYYYNRPLVNTPWFSLF